MCAVKTSAQVITPFTQTMRGLRIGNDDSTYPRALRHSTKMSKLQTTSRNTFPATPLVVKSLAGHAFGLARKYLGAQFKVFSALSEALTTLGHTDWIVFGDDGE